MVTTENHNGGGCNIAFVDGSVEFVKAKRLGKLRWTVDEPSK
jgi:prepilin-type processing-associated H-X9-DG protein